MNSEQRQAADILRSTLGYGDRRIAAALGLSYHEVRKDREMRLGIGLIAPPPEDGPRILLYDLETTPSLCWVWNQYQTNVIATEKDWSILCFSYKWLGQDEIHFVSVYQDPDFEPDSLNDRYVVERLHALFDQADVLVAHNGDKFDKRKSNARFLYYGMDPPSPAQTIDTKKEAARYSANYSNSLSELGRLLKIGKKVEHRGFELWRECMRGDPKAWAEMEEYNRGDIALLEALYYRLRPWIGSPGHAGGTNFGLWSQDQLTCPKCGSHHLIKRGTYRTKFSEWQALQCVDCRGYSRTRKRELRDDGGVGAV